MKQLSKEFAMILENNCQTFEKYVIEIFPTKGRNNYLKKCNYIKGTFNIHISQLIPQ